MVDLSVVGGVAEHAAAVLVHKILRAADTAGDGAIGVDLAHHGVNDAAVRRLELAVRVERVQNGRLDRPARVGVVDGHAVGADALSRARLGA